MSTLESTSPSAFFSAAPRFAAMRHRASVEKQRVKFMVAPSVGSCYQEGQELNQFERGIDPVFSRRFQPSCLGVHGPGIPRARARTRVPPFLAGDLSRLGDS